MKDDPFAGISHERLRMMTLNKGADEEANSPLDATFAGATQDTTGMVLHMAAIITKFSENDEERELALGAAKHLIAWIEGTRGLLDRLVPTLTRSQIKASLLNTVVAFVQSDQSVKQSIDRAVVLLDADEAAVKEVAQAYATDVGDKP